jgi:GH15 family glucan-1,4-alpha-glucosidase
VKGAFIACSFWEVIALYALGRDAQARQQLTELIEHTNAVVLPAEEIDPHADYLLGSD